ncbi:phage major capsid protein [Acidaminococcus fermentans]|uniref:phage major capsid protein n=1 Tax=Acidaminococcus fermentans TaxID=905 RepID=UPI0024302090|nr:phage major capsid protein [Acidaminococcus fermentans]MCI6286103.1 phage major capsid protein [Acidaminococcus fermentans]
MNQILKLREERANTWEMAKAFLESHRDKDGMVSAEDSAVYDRMEEKVVALGKEIERLERQRNIDDDLNKTIDTALKGNPGAGLMKPDEKKGRASDAYTKAFWQAFRGKGNIQEVKDTLTIGSDPEGGYLVPDEYEHTLVEALLEENFFRGLAHTIRTSSGDHTIPVVASHGEAAWMEEGSAYPESDDTFSQVNLGAHKLGTAIRVSEELMNDSVFDLESYITQEFARRIGTKEEEAFLVGDGNHKPLGVFQGAEVGMTAAKTAITFDDMMDLYHSLRTPYRRNASWILNDSTVKAIRKLKDNNGNYIWQPSVQVGQPDRILSLPYRTSSFVPELAAGNKVIALGDYSYYWIADRQGRKFKRLSELYAANGQIGFLASERVDGRLILPETVKVLKIQAG